MPHTMSAGRARVLAAVLATVILCVGLAPAPAQAASAVPRLGSAKFAGPNGEGWGKAHPKRFFNGGDPSGLVYDITWHHWGRAVVHGHGKNPIFKPGGGYYRKPARIELRARSLGHCGSHPAYTHLWVREPSKPGGKPGKWHSWSYHNHTLCTNGF